MSWFGDLVSSIFGGGGGNSGGGGGSLAPSTSPRPRQRGSEPPRPAFVDFGDSPKGGGDRPPEPPPPPPPPPPPAPPPPAPPKDELPWWLQPLDIDFSSGLSVGGAARVEQAGERAASRQRELGRAQTIATSPSGIVSTGETTRRRRSLVGGQEAQAGLLAGDEDSRQRRSLMGGGLIR